MLVTLTAALAAAAHRELKSNVLLSVFHDYISLACFPTAHWGDPAGSCGLEEHAVFTLDVGLTDDLRGSSG